jgi:hypothetical protein
MPDKPMTREQEKQYRQKLQENVVTLEMLSAASPSGAQSASEANPVVFATCAPGHIVAT